MYDIQARIDERLNQLFNFKRRGDWYREGVCPQCGKKELYTHAVNPRIVKCGRLNKCGYEEHVKDICSDLFKDWSKDFPKTETNPTAAADAYLTHARGLDIDKLKLKGLYTQELFQNRAKFGDATTATIRFKLAENVYWERFLDRPERFGRQKANFIGSYQGLHWTTLNIQQLGNAKEIWITEGIFNALALIQNGQPAIASMSTSNYPQQILDKIAEHCKAINKSKPTLIWAFDNDPAGKKATQKFHLRAVQAGWHSSAALPPYATKDGKDMDWNDLHLHDQLHSEHRQAYRHYGKLFLAQTPEEAALLIYNYKNQFNPRFTFEHQSKLFHFNLDIEKFIKCQNRIEETSELNDPEEIKRAALQQCMAVQEICNAVFKPIYFQRNEITDESWYYIDIKTSWNEVKATFTADQLSSRSKFKPRLMSVLAGAMWTGDEKILESYIKRHTEKLKEVKTIDYIGYSKEYQAYFFDQYAVHNAKVIHINKQDYFKVGRNEVKTLAKTPQITINPEQKFNGDWWHNFYRIYGSKGLIVLAWWTGSYFAEQIRAITGSYPFIEVEGEAGAGKSRLIEALWKFSGRANYEGFDPNKSTNVAIYRNFAQISNLPVVLIEADRNDIAGAAKQQKFSWDELKDAFNGRAIRAKGLKTAGNETYEPPFRGAIMISQNTPIKATEAILTRTLHLHFDRKGQTLETKRLVDQLDKMPLEQACTYITHCLQQEKNIIDKYSEIIGKIENDYHKCGISHTRIALCHAQVAALIECITDHVFNGQIDYEDVADAQDMLLTMAQQRIDELNGDCPEIEQFFEVYEYLQATRLPSMSLNHHDNTAQTIAINLNEVYKAAARSYQQLPEISLLKRLLKTSQRYKFIESNRVVTTANCEDDPDTVKDIRYRSIRCWIFSNPNAQGTTK